MKIGTIWKKQAPKVTLRQKECQTCEYSRLVTGGNNSVLLCVFDNPKVDLKTSQAVWPVVWPDDVCRRHKYDNKG